MPILSDFTLGKWEDGTLTITMTPPVAIGGWNVRAVSQHRFGGMSGFAVKSMSSGFMGVSGITIQNSGVGIFNISYNSADSSGLDPGAYATTIERLDAGNRTQLDQGFFLVTPAGLP